MKTRALTLALLLLAAAAATAQVPRTINYQGRITTRGGEPFDSTTQMTIRLYDTETGGTPLHTEVHPSVTFKKGIFTVGIGTADTKIPETISFDKQLWMGVTIAGVNNGDELTPRFILRSSPYSFRSIIADSAAKSALAETATTAESAELAEQAKKADSARYIITPASITHAGKTTGVQITNTQGTALEVKGSPYALVTSGIDSTTEHYVAQASAGSANPPAQGGFYRDNAPIAWGTINTDGVVVADFGITSVTVLPDNSYLINLSNPVKLISLLDQFVPDIAPVITLASISQGGEPETIPAYASWSYRRSGNAYDPQAIVVKIFSIQASGQVTSSKRAFSIVVFGRP